MDDDPAEAVPDTELFLDDRGSLLRVRWASSPPSASASSVQLSLWRDGRCVATHQLSAADAHRLASMLTQGWIDSMRRSLAPSPIYGAGTSAATSA